MNCNELTASPTDNLPMATEMAVDHSNLAQKIRRMLTEKLFKLAVASLCFVVFFVTSGLQAQSGRMVIGSDSSSVLKQSKATAQKRAKRDALIYSSDDLRKIETIYQRINRKWNKKTAKSNLDILMAQYPQANRTGCALQYYAQLSRGNEQKKLLEKAIKDYSDCFYGDGVQVGAYARYCLALFYQRNRNIQKANKIFRELKSKYPNAIDHAGDNLVSKLRSTLQKNRAKSYSKRSIDAEYSRTSNSIKSIKQEARARRQRDLSIYSPSDLQEIETIYQKVNRKWDKKTAKASLDILMTKYSKANRTGCALLYYAQLSRGDEQKELLEKAIKDYSDCFYGDGVQVGAYARYCLALFYLRNKNIHKAKKTFKELKSKYPNAIDHGRVNLVSRLNSILQNNR